ERSREAAEERDRCAGGAHPEEVQSAHHGGREDAERNRGAKVKRRASQHGSWACLKEDGNGVLGFPGSREVWLAAEHRDGVQARQEQKHEYRRYESQRRTGVANLLHLR